MVEIVSERSYNLNKSKLPKHISKDGAKWIMVPTKVILDGLCVWPETQNNLTRASHLFWFVCYFIIIVGQINKMIDKNANLASMCYTTLLIIVVVETTVRRILCYYYRKKFNKILYKVYYEFWPSTIAGNKLHEQLSKYSWFLFLFTAGYTASAAVSGFQLMTVPYFKGELPYSAKYFFSWHDSPWYEIIYVWQAVLMMELVFNVCGLDLFFVSLLCNCIAQFKLLRGFLLQDFEKIIKETANYTDEMARIAEIKKSLLLCIQHHKRIIRVCTDVEEAFTNFIVVQYLTSGLTVCVATFVGVVIQEDAGTALTYLMGHICEILIYCYMGNELINESIKLSDTIFHSGWHHLGYDNNLQRSLLMVMVRSQQPVRISVGGFGVLSLPGFFKLMQFSFSIYALLNSLLLKQNETK